jgi:hypothetical protein
MNRAMFRQIIVAGMCLLGSPLASAAGQICAAMEASGPQWFATQLDGVQATYQSGNSQDAYQQLRQAMFGLPRRADVSLDARCVGPDGWQRMYQLRRAITATLGKQSEQAGKLAKTEGALDWYVLGGNRDDARRVIKKLTPTAKGTAFIISRLRNEIDLLDQAQESGFELLPEEVAARAFWQKGLDGTIRYARSKVIEVLEAESGRLTREALDEELKAEESQRAQQSIAADFFGDASLAPEMEWLREVNQAKGSLTMLQAGREWAEAVSADDAKPVNNRALERGDALLVRAGNSELGVESRDALYQAATDYFEFAGKIERVQKTERARAQIAPELKAAIDQRNAKISQQGQKLKESAQQMKQSTDKTEAQKKSFKDEADAMEDELGF